MAPLTKPSRVRVIWDAPMRVRSWLCWRYDHWAADFAEVQDLVGRKANNVLDEERTGDSSFLLVAEVLPHDPLATGNLNLEQLAKRPKVLPPNCMMSLFEVYAFQNGRCPDSQGCASKRTFKREFSLWKKILIFQRTSDHARCTTCGRYAELRSKETSEEQKANICANHAQHIVNIFADRDTEAFFDRLRIESARLRYAQEVVPFKEFAFQGLKRRAGGDWGRDNSKSGGEEFGQFQTFNGGIWARFFLSVRRPMPSMNTQTQTKIDTDRRRRTQTDVDKHRQ